MTGSRYSVRPPTTSPIVLLLTSSVFCILVDIFDCCHSGTLLDLPHYHCNNVWVPWISKGERRTKSRMNYLGQSILFFG